MYNTQQSLSRDVDTLRDVLFSKTSKHSFDFTAFIHTDKTQVVELFRMDDIYLYFT